MIGDPMSKVHLGNNKSFVIGDGKPSFVIGDLMNRVLMDNNKSVVNLADTSNLVPSY